jgi:predicted nucleic acid-binding protein
MALVRVLSNPAFSPRALTPDGALQVLRRNVDVPEHRFWPDSIDLREAFERMPGALTGHQQITDAYLVALAIHNKGKLATLDRGILKWAPAGSVEVIG